jgi:hypothetical protein
VRRNESAWAESGQCDDAESTRMVPMRGMWVQRASAAASAREKMSDWTRPLVRLLNRSARSHESKRRRTCNCWGESDSSCMPP